MNEGLLDVAAALLVLTALFATLNRRLLRLPMTIGVMAVALVLSLGLVALDATGVAPGLRERERAFLGLLDFPALLMQGMLSFLLFAGALQVDLGALRARLGQVGALAFLGTALSTAVVGLALWALLPLAGVAVPLLPCLLFGALISPTDPIAVIGMLKSAGAPRELEVVIAGESLFNDGVGVVIFSLLAGFAADGRVPGVGEAAVVLLREAGGGLVLGWLLGQGVVRLVRRLGDPQVEVLLTLASVVGGYALAAHLEVSGPLAMVVTGLLVGRMQRTRGDGGERDGHLGLFWELVDEILNAVLFVLVGMEVAAIHVPLGLGAAVLAGGAAIVATLAARWFTVGLPVALAGARAGLPRGSAALLTWGGLRGGLSLAMALALPAVTHRETLVALAYAVVAFSILVQGLSFARLVKAVLR